MGLGLRIKIKMVIDELSCNPVVTCMDGCFLSRILFV